MDDDVCPRCRTTKYRNPSLRLMVNVCGHTLCDNCVELLFLKGAGSCPECGTTLKKSNYRLQIFEDPYVEKEVNIRKRVLKDYNKKEGDFVTLNEYNDYLEEVETLIYNLSNDINVMETNRQIEQYKKENKELIYKNKVKLGLSDIEIEEQLEEEKQINEMRKNEIKKEEMDNKKNKIKAKEALIDELMFSNSNASNIINEFNQRKTEITEEVSTEKNVQQATQFSTGIKFTRNTYDSQRVISFVEEGSLYVYCEPSYYFCGPLPPTWEQLTNSQYVHYMRAETIDEKAGGYDAMVGCMRSIQEAVSGLYHSPRGAISDPGQIS